MEQETQPELVIQARPQVIIEYNDADEITISTSRIGDDFERVEHETVVIPGCDLDAVMEALQQIRERRR